MERIRSINHTNIKDFLKEKNKFLAKEEKGGRLIFTIIILILGFLSIIS